MEEIICKYDHISHQLIPQLQGIKLPCRLENYIQCWNHQPDCYQLQIDVKSDFNLRIVYHSCKSLYNGNRYNWSQNYYAKDGKLEPQIPTIHLTIFDVFNKDNPRGKEEDEIFTLVQRHKKVVDSSIWNFYVPIRINESVFDFEDFKHELCEIGHNYDEGRYSLSVSLEYADLHARLLEQSYLKGGHKVVSPFLFHSESEMKNKLLNLCLNEKSIDKKKVIDEVKKYKWRFLLLDDKSVDRMSGIDGQKVNKCKVQILYDNLHRILGFDEEKIWFRVFDFKPVRDCNDDHRVIEKSSSKIIECKNTEDCNGKKKKVTVEPQKLYSRVKNGLFDDETKKLSPDEKDCLSDVNDIQIVIDCVKHVDAAQYCLQKNQYDIVLIDYLLYKDKIKGEHKQEYGYQLLEELWKWNKMGNDSMCQYMIGPNNRLTIMFISAFTTAVNERILEMGLGRSEPGLWYIGNGACPTNTPYLFSHLLLQLMRHRIEDLSRETEGGVFSVIDLLDQIYLNPERKGLLDVREYAHQYFNSLLFMREKYKRLEKDLEKNDEKELKESPNNAKKVMDMKSSLLVWSAFKVVHHFSGAFFDHLQHLVYLTAFGTVRQWQEMWEEYVFVHKELCEYDRIVVEKDNQGEVIKRGSRISDAIHSYIIKLKENSN